MKIKSLMLIQLWLLILFSTGCQLQDTPNNLNEDLVQILQSGYYIRLPADYDFDPWGGNSGDQARLESIKSPETYPVIWIFPFRDTSESSFLLRTTPVPDEPDFGDDFLPPEKIAVDQLEISLAKYALKEESELQTLAQGKVVNKAGNGLFFDVLGNFSQQEEGYRLLKELLQTVSFVAPETTVEP